MYSNKIPGPLRTAFFISAYPCPGTTTMPLQFRTLPAIFLHLSCFGLPVRCGGFFAAGL